MSAPRPSAALTPSSHWTVARIVALAGIAAVALLAWGFLWRAAVAMSSTGGDGAAAVLMDALMRPGQPARYLPAAVSMWIVMAIAMMAPAVLPVVTAFWRLERGATRLATWHGLVFAAAYLVVWCGTGLVFGVLQFGLHRAALLQHHLFALAPQFGAALLVAAGVYQLTPFKHTCLVHCREPLTFMRRHARGGAAGAFAMGLGHGAFCVGCCWAMMLLMFVGGVMSLGGMALIAMLLLIERLLPLRPWATTVPGIVLIAAGLWTLLTAPAA
ncbi:MAG: DUF2182 domain-containing protein [Gammaproteobacteria bacterium]